MFWFLLAHCRLNGQITGAAGHVFRSGRVCISTNAKWESIQMLCKYLNAGGSRSCRWRLAACVSLFWCHPFYFYCCAIFVHFYLQYSVVFCIYKWACVCCLCMKYSALQFGKCHDTHTNMQLAEILRKVQNSLWRGCWLTKQTNKQTNSALAATRSGQDSPPSEEKCSAFGLPCCTH